MQDLGSVVASSSVLIACWHREICLAEWLIKGNTTPHMEVFQLHNFYSTLVVRTQDSVSEPILSCSRHLDHRACSHYAQLRSIAKAAGVERERNYVQMVLMDKENAHLRQQLQAKKQKRGRTYTTGHARLMTGPEMQAEFLKELQKKQRAEMLLGGESRASCRKTGGEREAKAAAKEAERAIKAAEKEAAKAAKAAEKEAAKAARAAARARGRGRRGGGRGGRRRDACSRGAVRGGVRGGAQTGEEAWDSGDEEDSAQESPSDDESDADANAKAGPHATDVPPSDEETDSDAQVGMQDSDESDSDDRRGCGREGNTLHQRPPMAGPSHRVSGALDRRRCHLGAAAQLQRLCGDGRIFGAP
ncbi:hypothetical protein B0H19DRAFT_1077793 [Mycena capillaripes]|nr:hypothetical protein B0H19DRAFT_1077793 [Mycena capillaripes]